MYLNLVPRNWLKGRSSATGWIHTGLPVIRCLLHVWYLHWWFSGFILLKKTQLCLHLKEALWAYELYEPTNTDEGNNTAVKAIHAKANLNKVSFFEALLRNRKISHKKSVWLEKSISSGDQTSCFPTTCPSVTPGLVFKKWWNNEKKILSMLTSNILKCISKLRVSCQYLIVKIG